MSAMRNRDIHDSVRGHRQGRPMTCSTCQAIVTLVSVKEGSRMSVKHADIEIGTRFGRLVVLGATFSTSINARRMRCVVCECDCGNVKVAGVDRLRHGRTKSCGCLQASEASRRLRVHGGHRTLLYGVWATMLQRCKNPNVNCFHRYGGRGIYVCSEWSLFESFREWAISAGYEPGLTIERDNSDGPYEPSNCRWATRLEQGQNTSKCRMLHAFGETKTLSGWSRDSRCLVNRGCLRARLTRGWTVELSLTTPLGAKLK